MSKLSSSSSSSASSSPLSSSSCLLPDAGKISVTVIHDSSKSYGLRLRTAAAAAAAVADTDTDNNTDNNTTIYSSTHSSRSLHSRNEEQNQQRHRNVIADEQRNDDDHGANSNNNSAGDDGGGARCHSVVFEIDMLANHHPNSLLQGSPFQEGDVLQTINNNRNIQEYLLLAGGDDSDHTTTNYSLKSSLFEDGQTITFVVERRRYKHHHQEEDKLYRDEPQQNQEDNADEHRQGWYSSDEDSDDDWEEEDTDDDVNDEGLEFCPAIVRAFYRKPILDTESLRNNNSVIEFHQVVVNDDDDASFDDASFDDDDDDDDDDNISSSSNSSSSSASICSSNAALDNKSESSATISTKTDNRKVATSSFLQIDRIDSNGMLAYSVLNQGDIVLAINGVSVCADSGCTAEDAQSLLGDAVYDTIDIIALNPKKLVEFKHKQWQKEHRPQHRNNQQRQQGEWMKKHIQRASAAIGGGTLIGAGLVIHPFGVALMAGGISVLSKEFDAPKRAVRNVRNSLERWATEDEEYDDDDASCNSVDFHSDVDDGDIVYSLEGTHSPKHIATTTMKRPIYPSIVTTTGRIQNSNNNSRSNIIADDIDTIIGSGSDSSSFDHRRNDNEPFYHDGNHVLRSSHYDLTTREDESTISNNGTVNNGYSNSNRIKNYVSVRCKSPTDRSTSSSCRLSSPSLLLSQPSSPSSERKTTITNRVKGFGRRFVIPFLDRMAGSDDTKADGRNSAFSKNDCRTISQELRDDTISY